ncbi:MAG: hypothetical protein IH631_09690, partial [Candidatus Thorarchaeota archaeon]|nr:hypothetical protein [Candidatus Thorarchaeota archaeon]
SNLGEEIVTIKSEKGQMFMTGSDFEVASAIEKPDEDLVWFLPYEDHFLKAFIDRTNFIDESIQPMLFPADRKHFWPSNPEAPLKMPSVGTRATGEVRPSIWLNGQVVGRWEIDDEGSQKIIVTSIYTKNAKKQLSRIEEVKTELEDFVNDRLVPISQG